MIIARHIDMDHVILATPAQRVGEPNERGAAGFGNAIIDHHCVVTPVSPAAGGVLPRPMTKTQCGVFRSFQGLPRGFQVSSKRHRRLEFGDGLCVEPVAEEDEGAEADNYQTEELHSHLRHL